jgi:pimeloyl-ACP methyl ester carboxylesterase
MTEKLSRRKWLEAGVRAATGAGAVLAAGTLMPEGAAAQDAPPSQSMAAGAGDGARTGSAVTLGPGLQVHYKEDWFGEPWKTPETALFLHGNLENADVWWGWVPRMGQQFRLLRPDLPGFGMSSAPGNFEWSLANFATVMTNFLDKLGVASAHIIGAKTGGAIAMQFAAMYPQRVKTLVVASGPFGPVDPQFEKSSQKVRLGSAATDDEIAYFDKLRSAMRPETRAGMAKLLSGINFEDTLAKIQAPTLVITSDHSALQSVETILKYQPKIPNSRLLVLTSDAYHVAVANAGECVTSVVEFIRQAQRAG